MLLALVLLGTWPAILAQLERRGRLPQHTYLDYSITNFLTACFIAVTLGQIGDDKPNMPNFVQQLSQDNWPCILIAMAGGIFLSLGNLSTQYAWAFVGLSVTEVITSSIAVVLGTTLNYFLDDRINKAEILFPGVGCFLIAVCLGSAVHSSNAADDAAKLRGFSDRSKSKDEKATVGSAHHLIELENNRAIKVFGKSIWLGLGITFFAGLCYALFSPAFNLATNDQWHVMRRGVSNLVVYTAFFYFSLSFFFVAIVLNVWFLYRPVLDLPRSSLKSYLKDWNGRYWALLAGVVCGLGNGLQFMGGQAAEPNRILKPISISGKTGTPDRLKVPKAFKYIERYTSPTDQMMSPVTRGILARGRKGSKLLPPSANQTMIQAFQLQEFGPVSN
ncbi:ureide permease 2 [Phtheirospermum japonicum]|uniref:Ureide permease 2 n=1 Tax=Phtheirospermum japonicum TaxID=374723 RepID=A0A830BRH7_9LAMI|nr:ureide permease 2 [Phtheirospermum japonicum]